MVPDNGEIHHYTDTNGLIGIIQGEKLWATNIQFLNDSLEYDFGLQRATDTLGEAIKRLETDDSEEVRFTNELHESVQTTISILKGVGAEFKDEHFVCCFSAYCDDLGQWRGYAQEGYSITFDSEKLTNSISKSRPDERYVTHGNVTYGEFEWGQDDYADAVLSRMHEILHKSDMKPEDYGFSASEPGFGEFVRDNNRAALAAFAGVAAFQRSIPFLKETGFADEQERRICVSSPEEIKFRPSRIGPLPYTELAFDPESIKAITVGPGLNIELRQATLEYLLRQKFGKDHKIEIKTTKLSFRG